MSHAPWYVKWFVGLTVIVMLLMFFMPERNVARGAGNVAATGGIAAGVVAFSIPELIEGIFKGKDYMQARQPAPLKAGD